VVPRTRAAAAYLWLLTGVPVLGAWAVTAAGGHLFSERYMTYALPFWCGLVAAGVTALPRAATRIAAGAILVLLGARATWITPPSLEPASLARAADRLADEAAPDDTVFHADTHSLLFFRHHMPDYGRHVLLMMEPHLPYYEGAAVIPESWRVGPADFARVAGSGRPWWGVLTHKAGGDAGPAIRLFDATACCPPDSLGLVRVWRGRAAAGDP